jgi:hypothetical protein
MIENLIRNYLLNLEKIQFSPQNYHHFSEWPLKLLRLALSPLKLPKPLKMPILAKYPIIPCQVSFLIKKIIE